VAAGPSPPCLAPETIIIVAMASLFTQIIQGEIASSFVFKDERWVGILDISPVAPGHMLLIPVDEQPLLQDLPADTLQELGGYLAHATRTLRQAMGCDAVSVLLRDGAAAGQELAHVHVHCIPRWHGDDPHAFVGEHGDGKQLRSSFEEVHEKLRAAW